ncbi:leucine aminopeptidase A [Aspergillus pseudotamarii]|uniref:Peptide hydrolase n=1 Tax=Aspergillus pseudotamarii TaxID=132259 RepID=A0A5N6TB68_ASPPS|nr:leucine aminopeptidase A [Aspergillus pseudotamarii]KAE8143573.1 leucine aminopeptidase A [Aspergillus pseudotamarii]
MRFLPCIATLAATASALAIGDHVRSGDRYVLELAPGETKVVTEAEKWALRAEGKRFLDITGRASSLDIASNKKQKLAVTYPDSVQHNETVQNLIKSLDKKNFETVLQPFSEFHNRYYKSDNGKKSSEWLQGKIQEIISASGAKGVTVEPFKHSFPQSSLIAKIPGKSDKVIVLGAHQDSINLNSPSQGRAPGADDDGSGVVTILEAFRVLLTDEKVAAGEAPNTVEFHFYAGEEGGLLGSQDIFEQYSQKSRDVKAMLQQDMTGYIKGTTDAGKPESIGIIIDNVDENLTKFLKVIVDAYCTIPTVDSKCGYGCSDHASATKYGYPAAFAFESAFGDDSPYIHSADDTIDTVNFDHVLQHGRLTLGFAYELAFADSL